VPERLQQLLTGPEWINERITRWGVGSSIWQARVRGVFPAEADADAVIPLAWVVAAQDRYEAWELHKLPPPGRQVHGLDVGRSADQDETVLATRHGHVVYDLETWRVKDLEETTGRAAAKLRAMPTSTIVVDETGIGAGVLDALRGQGLSAVGFVAGGKNTGTDRNGEFTFLNNRAAAWWRLREALDPAHHPDLCLPLDDMLAADLTAPRWKLVRQGVIQIESKDDIRKRLGRSTDRGDAVVQSVWQSTLVGPDPDVAKWGDNAPTDQQASDAEIIADWLEDYA
jgi:PAS domain-containing protein